MSWDLDRHVSIGQYCQMAQLRKVDCVDIVTHSVLDDGGLEDRECDLQLIVSFT